MTSFDRRTTGQPSYNGLTETQFRFSLAGHVVVLAAALFAALVFEPAGFAVAAIVAFCLGYFCTGEERLNRLSSRAEEIEGQMRIDAFIVALALVAVAIFYFTSPESGPGYRTLVAGSCYFVYALCANTGRFIRACWNGFRI